MAQPIKHPITGIYCMRRKVPDDLLAALGREFKRSLKTRDPVEAKSRHAEPWGTAKPHLPMASLSRVALGLIELLAAAAEVAKR